ncbi:ABC transporter ATP-binding protein [Sediminispirochaeta bajacaliforniensis]|uniref:ABC transporter ATP-binding protein n=1 Tax=Sediminispirochaeta bajacaliforniensis TaxID=148 RepID=UPI000366A649|nr:ABC transporter ATP-binding protein [Sediminispirochaeta bajacaliforniensis]
MSPVLEMNGIVKRFPGVLANDHVDLRVEKGEVHALLGENGAGKSTLMNVLYGMYEADEGDIRFKDQEVHVKGPGDAIALGIGMVHQHFMLVPALTVVENVILGMKDNGKVLDLKAAAEKITALAERYAMKIEPFALVGEMSVGQQQRLEILKALYRGAELLILDEPTAVLTPQEVKGLFNMIRAFTSEGRTVIFISHKLKEVMAISDRVTVLRSGKVAHTLHTSDTDPKELARLMVGREIDLSCEKFSCADNKEVLRMEGVCAENEKGMAVLKELNLTIREGEILGVAGVDGNGQDELAEVLTGLRRVTSGTITMNEKDITNASCRHILNQGVSHIPADRQLRGMIGDMNVVENLLLMRYHDRPFAKPFHLDWKRIERRAETLVKEFQVKTPGIKVPMATLSGGNQQKVVLGREIERNPKLLVAMHPVRGLDIGATEYIHKRIIEQRDRGCAILLISTELEEILELSDRIVVMYEGEIMGSVDCSCVTIEQLGLMMAGHRWEEVADEKSEG